MGICEILTIVFVIFKLLGKIDWTWWAVFTPMYVAGTIYLAVLIAILIKWKRYWG